MGGRMGQQAQATGRPTYGSGGSGMPIGTQVGSLGAGPQPINAGGPGSISPIKPISGGIQRNPTGGLNTGAYGGGGSPTPVMNAGGAGSISPVGRTPQPINAGGVGSIPPVGGQPVQPLNAGGAGSIRPALPDGSGGSDMGHGSDVFNQLAALMQRR